MLGSHFYNLLVIFSLLMTRSARGITSVTQKRLHKLRDMILDRVTLKQGKTHCGRGLITDPITHVVTGVHADLVQYQPSVRESSAVNDWLFVWFASLYD